MIKTFRIGDLFKNSTTGIYEPENNIWLNNEELSLPGLGRFDYADEEDANRPIKHLIKNDEMLETIVKLLAERVLGTGVESGCTISEDVYDWQTAGNLSLVNTETKLTALESIPFVPPQEMTSSGLSTNWSNDISKKLFRINDGIIIGSGGEFYIVEPDYLSASSIITKVLRLDIYLNDTITIEDGDTLRYKCSISRVADGTSTDTTTRTLVAFEFNYLDYNSGGNCLYEELISKGFNNGIGTSALDDILYMKLGNRMALKGTTSISARYKWNLVILNVTKRKMETWYYDDGLTDWDPNSPNAYSRYLAIDSLKSMMAVKNEDYTLFYSVLIDGACEKRVIQNNGYQEVGLFAKTLTTNTGLVGTTIYNFDVIIDGGVIEIYTTAATGIAPVTFADLLPLLNAAIGTVSGNPLTTDGAEWRLINGDLRCTSLTSGAISTIVLSTGTGTDIFTALTDFTTWDSAVLGNAGTLWYIDESVSITTSTGIIAYTGDNDARKAKTNVNNGDEWYENNSGKWYKWNDDLSTWVQFI